MTSSAVVVFQFTLKPPIFPKCFDAYGKSSFFKYSFNTRLNFLQEYEEKNELVVSIPLLTKMIFQKVSVTKEPFIFAYFFGI